MLRLFYVRQCLRNSAGSGTSIVKHFFSETFLNCRLTTDILTSSLGEEISGKVGGKAGRYSASSARGQGERRDSGWFRSGRGRGERLRFCNHSLILCSAWRSCDADRETGLRADAASGIYYGSKSGTNGAQSAVPSP